MRHREKISRSWFQVPAMSSPILGVQNPTEKQTKVRLAVAINQIIQARKLSQTAAARRLKLAPSRPDHLFDCAYYKHPHEITSHQHAAAIASG
jgi:predicted XRE-type DNA-binding protein